MYPPILKNCKHIGGSGAPFSGKSFIIIDKRKQKKYNKKNAPNGEGS